MKKVILSIALVAGIFATANIQATNSTIEQPIVEIIFDDDGFVDVKFEDLNEKVQEAVRGIAQEYDLNALRYNAEKQITKVVATSKEDQSQKTIYFDAEGKETTFEEPAQEEAVEQQQEGTETPSADNLYASQDDGFVNITFDELNEKVQDAVRAVAKDYDLNVLQYNAEKQITKLEATKKDDQSKKTFYFDAEGQETTLEEKKEEVQQEETMEQQPMLPSSESFYVSNSAISDDGFVEVKLEDLNEKVQAAINALKETYDVDVIKYNAEKQITKVKVTNKTDQSKNKFYFDNKGVETTWEEPVEDVEKETKTEEVL